MRVHRGQGRAPERNRRDDFVARGKNEVWTWDISYIASEERGTFFFLYLTVDIWNRCIVGRTMHETESGKLAADLLEWTCLKHHVQRKKLVVHQDNGAPMLSAGIQPYMELMIPEEADDEKKIDLTWNNRVRKDIRRGAHFPVERVLARLKTRTLILWGSKDEILPVALAEEWKKRVPRARLVVLDGLGHIAQEDDPVAVFGEIENFVSH